MTDGAFKAGMAQMAVTFPSSDEDASVKGARSQVYRRILDHLTDEAWLYAVEQALRHDRWFPAPAILLDYAEEYVPKNALPEPRSLEELEQSREAARANVKAGLELIRKAALERGLVLPPSNPVAE